MSEKVEQLQAKSCDDLESNANDLHHKKRMRKLCYITAFVVFCTVIILVFSQTVFRSKAPKFRIRSISIEDLTISSSNVPSLNMKFSADVGVKNTNFGHFEFEESSITFVYKGTEVGEASVGSGKAKARSTKKMNVTAEVETSDSSLADDRKSGFLTLTSQSELNGKMHLIKVLKKNKTAEMNCTITVNLANKVVQDLKCE